MQVTSALLATYQHKLQDHRRTVLAHMAHRMRQVQQDHIREHYIQECGGAVAYVLVDFMQKWLAAEHRYASAHALQGAHRPPLAWAFCTDSAEPYSMLATTSADLVSGKCR